MASLNLVILAGNLTRDPETRQLPSGTAVADLGLAVNETYKNKNGETVEQTCFVDVVAWGKLADTCGQYLRKGSPVLVEGRLQLDQWTSKEGEKRSKLRVKADRIQFLGSGSGRSGGGTGDNDAPPASPTSGSRGGGGSRPPEPPVDGPPGESDDLPF